MSVCWISLLLSLPLLLQAKRQSQFLRQRLGRNIELNEFEMVRDSWVTPTANSSSVQQQQQQQQRTAIAASGQRQQQL
jgi:hypothetical protein